jgi:hypothetical protein
MAQFQDPGYFSASTAKIEADKRQKLDKDKPVSDDTGDEYWIIFTLFFGILLRLIGFVEFDFDSVGFSTFGVVDAVPQVRIIVRTMYTMSQLTSPRLALALAIEQAGNSSPIGIIAEQLCNEFMEDGELLDGYDISQLSRSIQKANALAARTPLVQTVPSVGLSEKFGILRDLSPISGIKGFVQSFAESYVQDAASSLYASVSRIVQCECMDTAFKAKTYPFSSPPIASSVIDACLEVQSVAEVSTFFLRYAAGHTRCKCARLFRYHSGIRAKMKKTDLDWSGLDRNVVTYLSMSHGFKPRIVNVAKEQTMVIRFEFSEDAPETHRFPPDTYVVNPSDGRDYDPDPDRLRRRFSLHAQ